MRTTNRGFTLVEVLAALAIGTLMVSGVAVLLNDSAEDTKGQQAALYQSQVTTAMAKYINANYSAVLAAATATTPRVISVAQLKAGGFLSANFNSANAYAQTPCGLVLQTSAGRLDALVVTEGGNPIPAKDLAYVAANAGEGGGYIPFDNAAIAQGAFNSWSVPLAGFTVANCFGATGSNHLASALFFDGPGAMATDFMYRNAQAGHPELNQMTTPLNMRAQAVENTSDALCVVGDATSYGRIAVDAEGALLNCQLGIWKRPGGSGHWKDPVAAFAALPVASNSIGDVRLTIDTGRAFSWNGSGWVALAVDQNGNLVVPNRLTANEILVTQQVTARTACSSNGLLSRDVDGMLMSCQLGIWRKFVESEITTTVFDQFYQYYSGAGDQNISIPLNTLPGSRPLFVSGRTCCTSFDDELSEIKLSFVDAAGNFLGYVSGCGAQSSAGQGKVTSASSMALTKVPENAVSMSLYMHSQGNAGNLTEQTVTIYNSR